ncbi:MAG: tetratricopeptide repeat protein [Fimbriimonadaceae bacterium]
MKEMIAKEVKSVTDHVDIGSVPDASAWRFGDLFRQSGDLESARLLYERAVKAARVEDRRVNDSLQLARVMAMQGDVIGAIKVAETTFSAPPTEKAPIMMSALYEIYPAGKGKGKDVELAKFLEKAIEQHMLVEVDPSSESGKAFLETLQIHVSKAWDIVLGTFAREQKTDLFDAAIKHREELDAKSGHV